MLTSITICKHRFPLPKKCRAGRPESEMNDGFEKMEHEFPFGTFYREKQGLPFADVPLFPAGATQKGMFHSLFKGVFRKLLSMVNNRSLVFRPSSSPKGRPTISFQCLQTNTSQIAGFLTCSLSTFFNTRRKYWTNTEKDLRNTQTFHLTSWLKKDRTFPIKTVDSVSWKCH